MAVSRDKAFEIFVKRAITGIQKEAWGRTREAKELRDTCASFLTLLEQHEAGASTYEGSLAIAVLHPLQLACTSGNAKVIELALGALHKLVAHAWLQGESSTSEDLMPDETDVVTRVIKAVIKCGEVNNTGLQLSVIRALLTFTTAEHFVAHGDSLMTAVRAVFNLALGSDSEDIKRTACNALLQILNTVSKRVTSFTFSACPTPRRTECEIDARSSVGGIPDLRPALSRNMSMSIGGRGGGPAGPFSAAQPPLTSRSSVGSIAGAANNGAGGGSGGDPGVGSEPEAEPDGRTAALAQMAEQHDIRGLEAAIGVGTLDDAAKALAAGHALPEPSAPSGAPHAGRPSMAQVLLPDPGPSSGGAAPSTAAAAATVAAAATALTQPPAVQLTVVERDVLLVLTAFCKLASREAGLTEVESYLHQGKLLALELLVKVLQNPQHRWENVRDAFTRHLRQPLCITLLRNWAASDAAAFQLSLKLLAAVLQQPRLRNGLKAELGAFYPLFVLLPLEQGCTSVGSAVSPDTGAAASLGLARSESSVGRASEATDLHTLYLVLTTLRSLAADTQLVVDMFVNYDCDPQAPPLFERTIQVLGRVAQRVDVSDKDRSAAAPGQPPAKQQAEALARLAAVRDAALKCSGALLHTLHMWATPLREAAAAAAAASTASEAPNGVDSHDSSSAGGGPFAAEGPREAERLEAVWAHKSSLAKGLSLFNTSPVKGAKFLISHGLVDKDPKAVAAFLREHAKGLDKGALGEYFGHHEAFEVGTMHAYIEGERYRGQTIDAALRSLLRQFRLPGEAQKIDRIMEKFAERYYLDNPGAFVNADGAYLLAFAIIMLNTDAHNPLAERRLAKPDFVAMCHQPLSEEDGGGMVPVLQPPELEAIYDRIVAKEIVIVEGDGKTAAAKAAAAARAGGAGVRTRLASALGLHALAAPFRPLTRAWGKAQQGLSEAERKRRLVELAERAITRGVGSTWVSAHAAELARPMLTVAAGPMLDGFAAGVAAASTAAAAEPHLAALLLLAQLAAALNLDDVCERAVGVLAACAGVDTLAPHGSGQEAKQVVALKALMSLAGSPEAGSLGSAWPILLRAGSAVAALVDELVLPDGTPAPAQSAPPTAAGLPGLAPSPFNKMFQSWGITLGPSAPASGTARDGAGAPLPAVKPAPGAAMALWAVTDGKPVLEQLYTLSTRLDGQAVVVYFRALAAVSREELEAGRPRLASLHRLVAAAHENTSRIRLIWARLWAIIGQHLTATACHSSQPVALLGVDALTGLATRLLSRLELTPFRAAEEALRPFVAVLRQSDDGHVRETVISRLAEVIAVPPGGLGSGWRTVLDALSRAAGDASAGVVAKAAQTLRAPVRALLTTSPPNAGHGYLVETVRAATVVACNRSATVQTNVAGVMLLEGCAVQLGALGPKGLAAYSGPGACVTVVGSGGHQEGGAQPPAPESSADGSVGALDGWLLLLSSLAGTILAQADREAVVATASQAVLTLLQEHCARWGERAWAAALGPGLGAVFGVSDDPTAAPDPAAGPDLMRPTSGPSPSPEFLVRAQQLFPQFVAHVPRAAPAYGQRLLLRLVNTALAWALQVHEPLIKLGLDGYELLLGALIARQDGSNLRLLLSRLSPALDAQLARVKTALLATARNNRNASTASSLPSHAPPPPWPAPLSAAAHMLLTAQRKLSRVLAQHQDYLPWPDQALFVAQLQSAARQCIAFNQSLQNAALEAAAAAADAAAAAAPAFLLGGVLGAVPDDAQAGAAPFAADGLASLPGVDEAGLAQQGAGEGAESTLPTTPPPSAAPPAPAAASTAGGEGDGDEDEDAADSILEAGTTALSPKLQRPPFTPPVVAVPGTGNGNGNGVAPAAGGAATAPAAPVAGGAGGQDGVTHAVSGGVIDAVLPAGLIRLELEAAGLALDALEHAVETVKWTDGQDGVQGPEAQLRAWCRELVAAGAASLTLALQTRLGAPGGTFLGVPPLGAAGRSHVAGTWLDSLRAPLLSRALLAAAHAPGAGDVKAVRALFPHVLALICSAHSSVREGVAVYFHRVLSPLIMDNDHAAGPDGPTQ